MLIFGRLAWIALLVQPGWASELKDSGEAIEWFLVPKGTHVVEARPGLPTIAEEDAARGMKVHSMLNKALSEYLRRHPDRAAANFFQSEEGRLISRELHNVLGGIYRKYGINPREYSLHLASRMFVRWGLEQNR